MAQHLVICAECGKQFDVNKKGGYYRKAERRYICKECAKKIKANNRKIEADQREASTGMRQTKWAMILKIVIGIIFVITSFTLKSASEIIIGIIIGLGLIAWGFLPYYRAKKAKKPDDSPEQ